LENRGNLFNLNQKIIPTLSYFKDVQFVMICPLGTEDDKSILDALDEFEMFHNGTFLFATPQELIIFDQN
jgi:hypothetical protein